VGGGLPVEAPSYWGGGGGGGLGFGVGHGRGHCCWG